MILRDLREDARQLVMAMVASGEPASLGRALLSDSFLILALWRLRCSARKLRVPLANTLLRRLQTMVFGIELGNGIALGHGVYFTHPIGIVVGGEARVGRRVRFLGSNTVGTARNDGHPSIGDDVLVGCGARILGPVRIGDRAVIGANAVVLADVPPEAVAVGIPARVAARHEGPAGAAGAGGEGGWRS
jgi:serine O-acetyltransferase